MPQKPDLNDKTVLITGAAHRLGATTARLLHAAGMRVAIHYRSSRETADALCEQLNADRAGSSLTVQGDLHDTASLPRLLDPVLEQWGRLDGLVNNASSFYPTPVGAITEADWDDLIGSNVKAPLFLAQAAAPLLHKTEGSIVNIVDIHALRPHAEHTVYSVAKAGLSMLTKSLARELGPQIRVNGVAPGAILWPETGLETNTREDILTKTALKRRGDPIDIARTVLFLMRDAEYITGQVIAVDGGRTIHG